jgi:hypothetical protein
MPLPPAALRNLFDAVFSDVQSQFAISDQRGQARTVSALRARICGW